MELATNRRRYSPRLKPLAACLAAALALGAGSVAADPNATSARLQAQDLPLVSTLNGQRPAPWRRQTPVLPISQMHHPVPMGKPTLPANTIAVTNCDDSGAGSLRDALQNVAVDGDTVDLTNLSCSTITLTTGSILFFQNSITLQGPGANDLYLDGGGGATRVAPLLHAGTGTLEVNGMTVFDGAKYNTDAQVVDARGGCIYSAGFVSMSDAEVKYCTVQNTSATYGSLGGGIYAKSGISLSNTSILSNSAYANTNNARGGGIFTPGNVTLLDSFVEGNTAYRGGGVRAQDGGIVKYSQISNNEAYSSGGIYIEGNATIQNSTISGNTAAFGAGMWLNGTGATTPITLLDSTVSGNNATASDNGGIFLYGGGYTARIANSTIAFNTTHFSTYLKYGAGLRSIATTIDLESNIIAGNTNDSGGGPVNDDVDGSDTVTLIGANNLIAVASISPPADTISADPKLLPLANNGGTTSTHSLSLISPAIDAGNNNAGTSADQRGAGFPRTLGAQTDIGAIEVDTSDIIFRNGFD